MPLPRFVLNRSGIGDVGGVFVDPAAAASRASSLFCPSMVDDERVKGRDAADGVGVAVLSLPPCFAEAGAAVAVGVKVVTVAAVVATPAVASDERVDPLRRGRSVYIIFGFSSRSRSTTSDRSSSSRMTSATEASFNVLMIVSTFSRNVALANARSGSGDENFDFDGNDDGLSSRLGMRARVEAPWLSVPRRERCEPSSLPVPRHER